MKQAGNYATNRPGHVARVTHWPVPSVVLRLTVGLMMCVMTIVSAANGSPDPTFSRLVRALPLLSWSSQKSMKIAGVPIHYRLFSSPLSAHDLAEKIARHSDLFQRTFVFRKQVLLSGRHSGWHWTAEIDTNVSGTSGVMSALSMQPMPDENTVKAAGSLFDWLPSNATLKFDQRFRRKDRWIAQRVYDIALPPSDTSAYIAKTLTRLGWSGRAVEFTPSGVTVWHRDSVRLILSIRENWQGSTLFAQCIE